MSDIDKAAERQKDKSPDAPDTATEAIDEIEAGKPGRGLSPDYADEAAAIEVDKKGVAHKRDS